MNPFTPPKADTLDRRINILEAKRKKEFAALLKAGRRGKRRAQRELKERYRLKFLIPEEIEKVYG